MVAAKSSISSSGFLLGGPLSDCRARVNPINGRKENISFNDNNTFKIKKIDFSFPDKCSVEANSSNSVPNDSFNRKHDNGRDELNVNAYQTNRSSKLSCFLAKWIDSAVNDDFCQGSKKVTSIYNDNDIFSDKTNGKCGYLPNTCRSKPNPLNRVQDSRHLIHHKDISQLDSNDQRIREFHHESKLYDKVYHISKWNCGESAQTQMSFFYHQICPFLASLMIIK